MRVSANGNGSSLAEGMTIVGRVKARLLGIHLLDVHVDVDVQPARSRVRRSDAALPAPPAPATNGSIGNGLDSAMRSLEATATDLDEARREMP